MVGLLLLLAAAVTISILAWLRGRPRKWIFPSDTFFILTVLVTGTVPFANLYAVSSLYGSFYYADDTVRRALICLTLMFLSFAAVWALRPKIGVPDLVPLASSTAHLEQNRRKVEPILWFAALAFVAISVVMLAYGPYRAFKQEVFNFLTAQISAGDYREARRILFADDPIIDGVMGRLRFGVLPVLFVALSILAVRRFGLIAGGGIAALAFVIGPASLSKAPIVIYLIYFALAVLLMSKIRWPLQVRNLLVVLVFAIPALLLMLTGIYYLQYGGNASGLWTLPDSLSLAYFRVFVATYDGLLKYLTVFSAGDVGVAGVPLIASLFGENALNLDLEVAYHFLGTQRGQYTSYPTIFVGNAYASFGYVGVVIYSLIVASVLLLIDKAFVSIRNSDLRIAFYACMTVNVLFFAVLAAPTALLTYGNAVLPVMVLAADRVAGTGKKSWRRTAHEKRFRAAQ